MYLLKTMRFNQQTKNVEVEDGIRVYLIEGFKYIISTDSFWGKINIHLGTYADYSKFPTYKEKEQLLSYVSEYEVKECGDNYKEFYFNVSTYQPEMKDGYIIFIKFANDIKTNGKKIFGRYTTEIVVVLKDGEYLEFDGRRVEVIDNQLVLLI